MSGRLGEGREVDAETLQSAEPDPVEEEKNIPTA